MTKNIFWGCFCETFILYLHPKLHDRDWFPVNEESMSIMQEFLDEGEGQIALPELTSYFKPITDFSLNINGK